MNRTRELLDKLVSTKDEAERAALRIELDNECLRQPEGLSAAGVAAYQTVLQFIGGNDLGSTGGCKAFYSPAEWRERGEEYGLESELILCHDGGCLAPCCNWDYECYALVEKLRKALEKAGCWVEQCTSWYSAVYRS